MRAFFFTPDRVSNPVGDIPNRKKWLCCAQWSGVDGQFSLSLVFRPQFFSFFLKNHISFIPVIKSKLYETCYLQTGIFFCYSFNPSGITQKTDEKIDQGITRKKSHQFKPFKV